MMLLPRPRLAGDKATVIACPMSDAAHDPGALVARKEAIRSGKVKPWEDNARPSPQTAASWRSMRGSSRPRQRISGSKINALVANVAAIWQRTLPTRSTQLIFADLGINATPWGTVPRRDRQAGAARHALAGHRHHWRRGYGRQKHVLFEQVRTGTKRIFGQHPEDGHRHECPAAAHVAAHHLDARGNARRSSSAMAGSCAEEYQRRGGDLPLRHGRLVDAYGRLWKPRPGLSPRCSPATIPYARPRTSAPRSCPTPR